MIDRKDADQDNYVTQKALDGLFLMIAEKEEKIRKDPTPIKERQRQADAA